MSPHRRVAKRRRRGAQRVRTRSRFVSFFKARDARPHGLKFLFGRKRVAPVVASLS